MKKLIFCLLLLFPSMSLGQVTGPKHRIVELGTNLLTVAALDSSKTFSLPVNAASGYSILVLDIEFVWSTASRVDVTCSGERKILTGAAGTGTLYVLQSCTVADGVCTSDDAIIQKAVTASINFTMRFGILGQSNVTCTASAVNGAVGDTVTVKGSLVTG